MTLNFKQIGEYAGDIVTTILKNRNVEDIRLFLNPDNSSDTNPFDIENMVVGVQVLSAHLATYSKIAVVVDADADGYLSSSMIYQYIKSIDKHMDVDYILHDNKAHGLTEEVMEKLSLKPYDLIIIPDAGSNDGHEISLLYAMGAEVLVLDHHIIEEMPDCGVIVNNQLGEKANKNLVGVGVTYKFCEALDYVLSVDKSSKLKDLVAVGQISDSSDISENEVRNLVLEGIKNFDNKFIKEALKQKSLIKPVPKDLSFSVIPMINAVIRIGTPEEKEILFRALNDINPEVFDVQKKKKNAQGKFDKITVKMNLQEYAVDIADKCKSRQDREVKKAVAQVEQDIDNTGGVAIGIADLNEKTASLSGLVATKMVNKLQKPVIILRDKDGKYTGSGRGYEPTMSSLKDWIQGTNTVEFAQGHDQAFGIAIQPNELITLKHLSKKVETKEFSYEVDYVAHGGIDLSLFKTLDKNKIIFGGKVEDPLFAFVGIDVPKKNIRNRGSVLTFNVDGVDFVLFGADQETIDKYTAGFAKSHKLDFIGRPSMDELMGKKGANVVLEAVDFSALEDEITEFNIIF